MTCRKFAWLLLGLAPGPAAGMVATGTASFHCPGRGERSWQYASKFAYATGRGAYQARAKLRDASCEKLPHVDLNVVLDEDWDRMRISTAGNQTAGVVARRTLRLPLGASGEWGAWTRGTVSQNLRTHIWYFILSSCRGEGFDGSDFGVDFEIRANQFDGSEFSIEQRHMPTISRLAWCALTAFLLQFAAGCRRVRQSMGTVHPVINALAATGVLQWAALSLQALHLGMYKRDGVGAARAADLAEVAFMLSQTVSATLLILIGHGYTLSCSDTAGTGPLRPTAAAVMVFHVVLVALDRLRGDTSCKYHEHEGAIGWLLTALRLLLYTWFMAGLKALRRGGGLKLCSFLQRFQLAGTMYFAAYPALFLLVQVFAPYLRHPIMYVGLLTMQTASTVWLARLFLSRGAYFELSSLGSSLLPGAAGHWLPAQKEKHV